MELRQLETLVAVLNHGGFTAAGEAIGLTQSAISIKIKMLEKELGVELFDRVTRPPTPTLKGLEFGRHAREILKMCSDLNENLSEQLTGALQLGTIPTIQSGLLPEALVVLRESHPNFNVNIISGFSIDLSQKVNRGLIAAAIVNEPKQLLPGLSWHPFVHEKMVVIAPENAKGKLDREILESLPFIRFQRLSWEGRLTEEHLRERGIKVKTSMEMDSLEAVSQMVAHGLGVSVVPQRDIAEPFPKHIRVIPFGKKPVIRTIGLIEKINNPQSHLVKTMYQILLDLVKKHSQRKK
ncbi:MAG: LysR family transcriptional regulator [Candidatus Marinimicrobia bacterium]|nr:LysR family transcriptional regulator [Candidatus Neomarinimicrobiota bacterium]MBL7011284.1 LysR family transcriptional regulator [Candidatus Neomarinimicrobiota bacterium]MBL7030108.1 LysR family transcriptional regulator [Candidatus Neomarinimicrobiota bacterium]